MRKEDALPVRLDPGEKQRLKVAAERMGLTVSALVRLLVRSFLEEYERQGGRAVLPPDWGGAFAAGAGEERKVAENSPAVYATKRRAKPATQLE